MRDVVGAMLELSAPTLDDEDAVVEAGGWYAGGGGRIGAGEPLLSALGAEERLEEEELPPGTLYDGERAEYMETERDGRGSTSCTALRSAWSRRSRAEEALDSDVLRRAAFARVVDARLARSARSSSAWVARLAAMDTAASRAADDDELIAEAFAV